MFTGTVTENLEARKFMQLTHVNCPRSPCSQTYGPVNGSCWNSVFRTQEGSNEHEKFHMAGGGQSALGTQNWTLAVENRHQGTD